MGYRIKAPFIEAGITIEGSGSDQVHFWRWSGRSFRYRTVRTPINLSAHSWRYAIQSLGFWRALMSRGFVHA